jgi:hypothetical protein
VPCDHPTIACIGSANRVKAISDHAPLTLSYDGSCPHLTRPI